MAKNLIDKSVMLEGTVPTEDVISTLHDVLLELNNSGSIAESNQIIKSFYNTIENWQIISFEHHGYKAWMQAPIGYYESIRKLGFSERVSIFIKRGIYVDEELIERHVNIPPNTKFPLELKLDPLTASIINKSDKNKFYFTVSYIIKEIISTLETGNVEGLLIYKRPAGIVAMNNTKYYLDKIEELTKIDVHKVRDSIEVAPFSDLITKSKVKIEFEIKEEELQKMENAVDKLFNTDESSLDGEINLENEQKVRSE